MGLTAKAAVVMVVSISSQIVCGTPRSLSKFTLKSNVNKSKKDMRMTNEDLRINSTDLYNSEAIHFPNVEYPLDSDLGESYRFLNDFHVPCKPEQYVNNYSSQLRTKYKRKLDKIANGQAKPQTTTSDTENCPLLSKFFPEVEYPLSARDMWIPNQGRLQHVKSNHIMDIDTEVDRVPSKNTDVSNNEPDYENLSLNTLIKSLNTKKTQVTETPNSDINVLLPNTNNTENILDLIVSNTTSKMNTDNDTEPPIPVNGSHIETNTLNPHVKKSSCEIVVSNPTFVNNVTNSTKESFCNIVPASANMPETNDKVSQATSTTKSPTNKDSYPQMLNTKDPNVPDKLSVDLLSKNIKTTVPPPKQISSTTTSEIVSAHPSTTFGQNSSLPIDKISTECFGLKVPSETAYPSSSNISTPLKNHDITLLMVPGTGSFDITDATTAVPFECVTSPMSSPSTVTNEIMFDQSTTTTTSNIVLTTNSPSFFTSATLSNSYQDDSIIANDSPKNALDIFQGHWTQNSNDSFTTCQLHPEDSDDWVIYVDPKKSFSPQENIYDYGDEDAFIYFDNSNSYLGERPQVSNSNKSQELYKNVPFEFSVFDTTNSGRTITDTEDFDLNNLLVSSSFNKKNGTSCASAALPSARTENGQSRENCTETTITLHVGDMYLPDCDTQNITQSVAGYQHEADYFMKESNTNDEQTLDPVDTVSQILYFEDSNSSLQYEYIDDTSASYTEMPYDLIL